MKLAYITRTYVPSKAAQSVQIEAMGASFSKILNEEFIIITPRDDSKDLNLQTNWYRIKKGILLFYYIKAIFIAFSFSATHIYTRDIALAVICSFISRKKITYEAHKEPKGKLASLLMKIFKNIRSSNKLVCISEALKNYYISKYSWPNSRVLVAHDGVFIERYDQYRNENKSSLRKMINLPVKGKILMHTGSIFAGRGQETFTEILEAFPDLIFVQVGGLKNDISRLEKKLKAYKNFILVDRVNWHELVKYQMSADFLFMPMLKTCETWWCASPLKAFEYLATGLPIISTNVGSIAEIFNSDNSIIFDPEIKNDLLEKIRHCINFPEETQIKSKVALNMAKKYTWHNRAKSIIKFISSSK